MEVTEYRVQVGAGRPCEVAVWKPCIALWWGNNILDRAVRRRATSLALNRGNGAVSQTFVL